MPTDSSLDVLKLETKRLGLQLDSYAQERFERYLDLLEEWRGLAGLTAIEDQNEIQQRLFGESLALFVALQSTGVFLQDKTTTVADIGSGGGFPGLPMKIVDPTLELTLIESHGRRCRFLETVIEELEIKGAVVQQMRVEDAGRDPTLREHFDLTVARALAPMPVLVEYALPLLRLGGILATPKGSNSQSELLEASSAIEALGGCTEKPRTLSLSSGATPQFVLLVRRCRELPARYPRRPGIPGKRPIS